MKSNLIVIFVFSCSMVYSFYLGVEYTKQNISGNSQQNQNAKFENKLMLHSNVTENIKSIITSSVIPYNSSVCSPKIQDKAYFNSKEIEWKITEMSMSANNPNAPLPSRMAAIQFLGLLGTKEAKEQLLSVLNNESDDVPVRSLALQMYDWNNTPQDLLNFINSQEEGSELKKVGVFVATTALFNKSNIERINEGLLNTFYQSQSGELQNAIVDYFTNKPQYLSLIASSANLQQSVSDHISAVQRLQGASIANGEADPIAAAIQRN